MNIFILEDDALRMQWFRERLLNHDITHADSCTQIERFQPPYDLIFLDHDLGGRQLEDHEDNGAAFAKLIAESVNADAVVIIHSYNSAGAQNIQLTLGLPTTIYAPFRGVQFTQLVDKWCG